MLCINSGHKKFVEGKKYLMYYHDSDSINGYNNAESLDESKYI